MTHYLEDAAQESVLRQSLRLGRIPVKMAYVGSAAETYSNLAGSMGYRELRGRALHEVDTLLATSIGAKHRDLQLCEIGPSDGTHTTEFLRELEARGGSCADYLGLDYSATLLKRATRRVRPLVGQRLDVGTWDIEEGPTTKISAWRHGRQPVVACLLGHTLGNVDDPRTVLRNIRDSCDSGDFLLLSVATQPPRIDGSLLRPYQSDEFREMMFEPLRILGLKVDDLTLRLGFDEDGNVFGDVQIARQITFHGVNITPGQALRCFYSRRFRPAELTRLLANAGWTHLVSKRSENYHQLSILSKVGAEWNPLRRTSDQ